jgi:lysyl oxidase
MQRVVRTPRWVVLASLVPALLALTGTASRATTSGSPSLRLRVVTSHVLVTRPTGQKFVSVDPGTYVIPVGGTFQVDVTRPDYQYPPTVSQVWTDQYGPEERTLPSRIADGWNGLARFIRFEVTNSAGTVVRRGSQTFCPNSFSPQRALPSGPPDPTFPTFCGASDPFPIGAVWGIDQGWGVDPFSDGGFFAPSGTSTGGIPPVFGGGVSFRGPDGRYAVTVSIAPRYVRMFGINPVASTRTVYVRVKTEAGSCSVVCPRPSGATRATAEAAGPLTRAQAQDVPVSGPPPQQYLPDLASLPAWNVSVNDRPKADMLTFNATEWVGGGSALDVEGFRQPNSNVMNAFQYFYENGQVVGRAPAGTMSFDDLNGHDHWHFQQFARYSLLDSTQNLVVRSHKVGFCIAPTDPVDLVLPGASLRLTDLGFGGACGSPTALWTREMLPLGWGDTYSQYVAGQAFNITDVPNGTYYVEVQVNPENLLYEQSTANDASLREVILGGRPGHRTVCVPAIDGVDQEGDCPSGP